MINSDHTAKTDNNIQREHIMAFTDRSKAIEYVRFANSQGVPVRMIRTVRKGITVFLVIPAA